MIVFGDRAEQVPTRETVAALADAIAAVATMAAGIGRHGAIAAAFVSLGQIVQGIADAERDRVGADGGSGIEAAWMAALLDMAAALLASWESGFAAVPAFPALPDVNDLPERITLRLPEGYAFYGVYPEGYAVAARTLRLAGAPRVIGIRSIGTGLAAMAAAALGAPPPITVRPIGHPFDRQTALTDAAAAALIDPAAHYIVVDEGPGLSGSSFAAVAGWLEARGILPERIAFLPSHGGAPGHRASASVRKRWSAAQRPVVPLDTLIPPAKLAEWVADLIGPVDAIEDISGGGWRTHRYADERDWPAVDAMQEKRKFLVRSGPDRWLVKFSGIGAEAARKLARARHLHAAGFVPEARGVVHGFLVQRWIDAAPAHPADRNIAGFAARYLGARARLLPPASCGASLPALFDMARYNIALALGADAAATFTARHAAGVRLADRVRRIPTDNRCDAHEWLRDGDGRLWKADALDHDAAHDLIGAQDLAWDAAGFLVEFDLDADRSAAFIADLEQASARSIDPDLLAFLIPCYLAFRLGAAQMAADALAGWPAEQARNHAAVAQYAGRIAALIAG